MGGSWGISEVRREVEATRKVERDLLKKPRVERHLVSEKEKEYEKK
jgi:hypothetical protein